MWVMPSQGTVLMTETDQKTIQIKLNDQQFKIDAGQKLLNFLEQQELASRSGIAVAVNNQVITRDQWKDTVLLGEENILVIQATQGG